MSVGAWQIVKRKYAKSAFTGEGARVFGGRWNTPGLPVVYTADSEALAALEILVHLDASELLKHYVVAEFEIDHCLVRKIDPALLPKTWRTNAPAAKTQAIGDAWLRAQHSTVLQVPSAIVASGSAFLLNPRHADFGKLRFGEFVPFRLDLRLVKRS